ncbi:MULTISPECIES: Panacea domain-containing protein [Bhargavaea]|uniref:Panacea domain-containing protein n=1 Tax=Bhargavaea changchunensis TaxID=2134037 RepID=A0ABW2NF63_9BACL|nr:type II toxin-antitoxin system antitoxin SocA domain-containing protein [Bhargavaea sp. CC-171006]
MNSYDATIIAGYIAHRALETGKRLTNLQLQKILYFLQAYWLKNFDTPLFSDEIQKWKLGPVVPDVYHEYKVFGSSQISYIPKIFDIDAENSTFKIVNFSPNMVHDNDRRILERITDNLSNYSGRELVNITHEHEPWSKDEKKILSGEMKIPYDIEEIKAYFKENPEKLEICNV